MPILRSAFPSLSFLYSILTNIKLNVGDSQKPSDWIGGMTTFINWAYLPENGAVIGLNDSLPYTLDYFWAAFTPWAKSHGFAGLSGMRGLGAMRFTVGAV